MNHSLQYQEDDGTNSNVIESFFSRVEKAYAGVVHRFSTKYLDWYMAMLSWKEDTRYMGLRWQFADLLKTITSRPTPRNLWAVRSPEHPGPGMAAGLATGLAADLPQATAAAFRADLANQSLLRETEQGGGEPARHSRSGTGGGIPKTRIG